MTKIEIDLRDLGLPTYTDVDGEPGGSRTLEDLIVDAAAQLLVGSVTDRADLRARVVEQYNSRIKEKVEDMITDAFSQPIQRTTRWGETQGEPTTIKEIIRQEIEKYLDSAKASRPGYSTDNVSLTKLVENEVKQVLTTDMKKVIAEAKANVHNTVTQKALAAAVAELSK
jgi:hypothetical protein